MLTRAVPISRLVASIFKSGIFLELKGDAIRNLDVLKISSLYDRKGMTSSYIRTCAPNGFRDVF
jgi:hypothetical protein